MNIDWEMRWFTTRDACPGDGRRRSGVRRGQRYRSLAELVAVLAALFTGLGAFADTYEYDDLGRLVQATLDEGTILRYQYDPAGNRQTVVVEAYLEAINDPGIQVDEDVPRLIDVLANDSGSPGGVLSIASVSAPSSGTASVVNSAGTDWIEYRPNAEFSGPDSFSYTLTNGQALATATVSVVVTSLNDAPIATNDAVTTSEDQAKTIYPLGNDSDPDADTLYIADKWPAQHGSLTLSGTAIIYTPNPNFYGTDSFTYSASDGELYDTATVTVTVHSVNDRPSAGNDSISLSEDGVVTFDPRGNDHDVETSNLTISGKSNGSKGSVQIVSGSTKLRYTPYANRNGSDSFSYTIRDGNNATDSATVSVSIAAVNDVPNAVNDSVSTNENVAKTFNPRTNDSDADGQSLTISSHTHGSKGSVVRVNGNTRLRYTPHNGKTGADSFTYTVSDGAATDTATVYMTIHDVNDPPNAVNNTYNGVNRYAWKTMYVLGNDSDPEGQTIRVTSVTSPLGGQVQIINNGGAVRYYCGSCGLSDDAFYYTITDSGGATDSAAVTVNLSGGGGGGGFPPF